MINDTRHSKKSKHVSHTPATFTRGSLCRALALVAVLVVLCIISVFYIFIRKHSVSSTISAYIYQNGSLIQTVNLSEVTEPYSFVIESPDGGFNTIEVRPGAIGICDADCPDKLCVSMGYADSSLLPIICLPHSLVIQVAEKEEAADIVTY